MGNKINDSNWGPYGNPNREIRCARELKDLPPSFYLDSDEKEKPLFYDGKEPKFSLSSIIIFFLIVLILSGLSETVREFVYEGRTIADMWYSGVDDLLDALGAPKLP